MSTITCPECGSTEYSDNNVCLRCGFFLNQLPKGTVLMNRYKVIRAIKAGGMGAIYLAQDLHDNKKYALKQMFIYEKDESVREYTIKRFTSEAELLVELDHPSIPKVVDYFCEEGFKYYMVMDFIEGRDLYTYIAEKGKGLPEITVIKWGIEVCDVLDYLHSRAQPIIHRDLNPTNLIVRDRDKRLVLVDFGFARSVDPNAQSIKTSVGTATFSAPEQCVGYPQTKSDIYSLGATMHFLLTGQQSNLSYFAPIKTIRPDISDKTERILTKALEFNPNDRFPTAGVMADALSEIFEALTINSVGKREDFLDEVHKISSHKPPLSGVKKDIPGGKKISPPKKEEKKLPHNDKVSPLPSSSLRKESKKESSPNKPSKEKTDVDTASYEASIKEPKRLTTRRSLWDLIMSWLGR